MRMASSAAGSSLARAMRLRSSRQERPASTRRRVCADAMTVELPLEPEARTVMRICLRYAGWVWIGGFQWRGGFFLGGGAPGGGGFGKGRKEGGGGGGA